MFQTVTTGRSTAVSIWYDDNQSLYQAMVTKTADKPSTTTHQDTDLAILFKQVRQDAGDKLAALSFRRFTRNMTTVMKALGMQKKIFAQQTKKDFAAIREAAKKARDAKKKTGGKKVAVGKKVGAKVKKTVKKSTKE